MSQVKKKDRVKVYYTGKLNDGTVFETNIGKEPLVFSVGKKKVIKGFEAAVLGMRVGQVKTVKFKPADAYGDKDAELIWTGPAADLPAAAQVEPGKEIRGTTADGTSLEGRITAIDGDQVTVDCNHPLAGLSLTFEIKLAAIG